MKLLLLACMALLLTSCARSVDVTACTTDLHIFGFFGGLWHGFIAPFDLIAMIWTDTVVYAPNNNGGWYAFGFCLGAGILFGGSTRAAK